MHKLITLLTVFINLAVLAGDGEATKELYNENLAASFNQKYHTWKEYCLTSIPMYRSDIDPMIFFDNEPFRDIVKLGIPAIPLMVEKQQEDHMLGYALYQITKWKWHIIREGSAAGEWTWFVEEFPDIRSDTGPPDSRQLWLRWRKEGQKHTDQYFEKLYDEWKELKRQNKTEEAKEKYQRIIDLGIAALPNIMQKVEQGDNELTEAISKLTDGKVEKNAKQSECSNWWKENKEKWLIPFPKPTEEPNEPTPK